ncbi:MAG: hypothetical protein ABFR97_11565 [Thermodesulfobacteriota bacterium]
MKTKILMTMLALALPASVLAQDGKVIECKKENQTRTISVKFTGQDGTMPCEVVYDKESGSQVLWQANFEADYCDEKATSLAEKQRGWGWDCQDVEVVAQAAPAASDAAAPEAGAVAAAPEAGTEAAAPAAPAAVAKAEEAKAEAPAAAAKADEAKAEAAAAPEATKAK